MATPARAPARLQVSLALIGFTAVTAQIVLLRELLAVFEGNEMSLGLMLGVWLLWTALGSSVLGRLRRGNARSVMGGLQLAVALTFPAGILLVRASRRAFHALPGEVLGPAAIVVVSAAALCLFCMASGWLFAAGARVYAEELATSTASATASVYLLEAIGSAFGGVLTSVLFIPVLSSFSLAVLVACANAIAAALALRSVGVRRGLVAATVLLAATSLVWTPKFDARSSAWGWGGLHLLRTADSPYGKLAVVDDRGTRTLYENGVASFNVPDPAAAEEAAHFAMLQHAAPRRVLLIGGGLNGSAAEILKYPGVERLDYAELDPMIFRLARVYFAGQWRALASDQRVRAHNLDGRLFVKTAAETYDVIIVNLPDPQTAQLNRFYTTDFFREAAAKLAPNGVLAFHVRGSENYISPELADFLRCLNRSLREVFAETSAIPGDTIHFFAAKRAGTLARDAVTLVGRLRARGVQTEYVREYYLPFRMAPDRMQELAAGIEPRAATPLNRDFAPAAYYFDVALWSGQFNAAFRRAFMGLAAVRFRRLTAGVLALFAVAALIVVVMPKRRQARASAGWCVAAMGFTAMALEMLLLLGFQAVYGYVYRQLAIVIGAFMAGMALGSWRALRRTGAERWALLWLQIAAMASPLALYAVLVAASRVSDAAGLRLASYGLFPALAVACGLLGGYQFPVAARAFFAEVAQGKSPPKPKPGLSGAPGKSPPKPKPGLGGAPGKSPPKPKPGLGGAPGALYALDLAGACAGALLLSAYLVPVFGMARTAALIAAVNLAPAAVAGLSAGRAGPARR